MLFQRFLLPFLLLSFSLSIFAQVPISKDTQAIQLITQFIAQVGGQNALSVTDLQCVGDITYNWAGKQVQGTVTIKARGAGQFRIDADLPSGTRSWYVNNGDGALRDEAGKITAIPFQNAVALGAITFPLPRLSGVATDTTSSVKYVGLRSLGSHQYQTIEVSLPNQFKSDPDGTLNRLFTAYYLFDPSTFRLVLIQDKTHPVDRLTRDIDHELDFADFRSVNGVQFPFNISERIAGQETFSIQLSNVTMNPGLTDSDFQF
jgi:hypothetical protein